jgi:hypothetical protein
LIGVWVGVAIAGVLYLQQYLVSFVKMYVTSTATIHQRQHQADLVVVVRHTFLFAQSHVDFATKKEWKTSCGAF